MEKSCKPVKETSKELGITFVWPETLVNTTVHFTCPKNSAIKLPRKCTTGGYWGGFDENGCGVLANNFTNLEIESKNVSSYNNNSCMLLFFMHFSNFYFLYLAYKQYIGNDGRHTLQAGCRISE